MRVTSFILCLVAFTQISFAADRPVLKIGTEGLYPPWNATNDHGGLEGFEIDLAQDLCRRMNVTCEIIKQRWDGMLRSLTVGKVDIVMARMPITENRKKIISFSTCYAAEASLFAVRTDNALASTVTPIKRINLADFSSEVKAGINGLRQALAGTNIGVQVASTHAEFVERFFPDLVDVRYYDTLDNLVRDLEAGRVDAALSLKAYWQRSTRNDESLDLALIGPEMIGDVFGEGVGAGVRKEDNQLRLELDKAIEAALADGTISKLAEQWFGYDLSCR